MRPVEIVKRLCPRARKEYIAAFESGDDAITAAGITTPKRLAHFLAQCLHETDGLTITEENGNYSAKRMMEVWPSRFKTLESAEPYAHNAEKLFNNVYGNRMGNGGPETGDGFRYRGRGILQTTGRDAYRKYGVDFESHPELVLSAEHALKPALEEWVDGGCNELADRDDLRAITRKINGGLIGLESRMNWLQKVKSEIVRDGSGYRPTRAVAAVAASASAAAVASASGIQWPAVIVIGIFIAILAIAVLRSEQ